MGDLAGAKAAAMRFLSRVEDLAILPLMEHRDNRELPSFFDIEVAYGKRRVSARRNGPCITG